MGTGTMRFWRPLLAFALLVVVAAQAAKTTTNWGEKAQTNIRCGPDPTGMSDDISVLDVENCKRQCEAVAQCVGFVTNRAKSRCFFRTEQSLEDCRSQFD